MKRLLTRIYRIYRIILFPILDILYILVKTSLFEIFRCKSWLYEKCGSGTKSVILRAVFSDTFRVRMVERRWPDGRTQVAGRANAGGRTGEHRWPEGRTQVAGGANTGGRRGEHRWPEGRTQVAGGANAETASAFAPPAAKTGRRGDKLLILREAGPESPENFPGNRFRVRAPRPRAKAKYLRFCALESGSSLGGAQELHG
jgi:hypothetical protein